MKNLKIASMPKALALLAMVAAPNFAGSSAAADPAVEITPVSPYQIAGDLLHTPSNIKWEPYGKNKRAKVVESEGVPGGQAIQIEVKRNLTKIYRAGIISSYTSGFGQKAFKKVRKPEK